ncbi:MAG: flagellar M-ring protein FliF [Deltaproteobacteria bacterium]|nr:flagellar M-ring protein FliF [Deltaproteobacteria bacterium]
MAVWDAALAQIRSIWGRLTVLQRIILAAVTLGVTAGSLSLVFWARTPEYSVLYSRLATDDAASVVRSLQEAGVPYRLADQGRAVLVPSDRVYELRLQLASQGIPQGGGVGFEIFDKTSFGMSDFAQKVNYSRALEGELTRTIRRLEGVEGARVHLVLPERRLFEEEAQAASASVVLQLAPGRRIAPKQVQAVVYLVSSSVEGLMPERVTVVDTGGNVLYQPAGDQSALLAANHVELKRAYEKDVERRVREMLERVFGTGTAVVQVSALLDFDKSEETSETFDPAGVAIRSEARTTDTSSGPPGGAAGVPGVGSNVPPGTPGAGAAPPAAPAAPAALSTANRENETINYEVSKKVTKIQRGQGALRRLTVAVAVDGTYRAVQGRREKEFVPRTADELAKIRSLVEKAVGFDVNRGDQVEVTSIPFKPAEGVEEARMFTPEAYLTLAKYGAAVLIAVLVIFAVLRPLLRWVGRMGEAPEVTVPLTVAELERRMEGAEAPARPKEFKLDETTPEETLKRETLKKRILDIVREEPETAAHLVRSWLAEE